MTALCSGGTSSSRAGFARFQYVGPSAVAALLVNIPTWAAVGIAAYIGSVTYDLTTYCSTDPPSTPTLTAQDFVDLFSPNRPLEFVTAQRKFQQWVGSLVWWNFCKCDTVATPAMPTPAAPPAGIPNPNPVPVAAQPCFSQAFRSLKIVTGNFILVPTTAVSLPRTVTEARVTVSRVASGAGAHGTQIGATATIANIPGQGSQAAGGALSGTAIGSQTTVTAIANTPNTVTFNATSNSSVDTDTYDVVFDFYCGGVSSQSTPCCEPDPILQGQLDVILSTVTLLQRQLAPFAYIPGTVHTGLSGAGSFAIQGLLGVKVSVTTLPASYGREGTSPTEFFDLGWLTFGTTDGYPSSFRLERNPQLTLPARCSAFTELAYDLRPGVVVTITELLRES